MSEQVIKPQPLSQQAFAEYGEVIETEGRDYNVINDGSARSYTDLATVDVLEGGGHTRVNIYESNPLPQPVQISMLERHPLGSQAFIPLSRDPFLVLVALEATADSLQAFVTNGEQGVNFKPGTWHHPLLVLRPASRFLVIDRGGEGDNCDIQQLSQSAVLEYPDID